MGNIIEENTFPENFSVANALWAATFFFEFWSYILLYGALALVMYDRHGCLAAVNGTLPPASRKLFHALFGMLTVLMILATVAASFMAIAAVSQGVRKSPDLNEFALGCSFLALWGFVTCYQIGIMVWAHKQALRANKYDQVRTCPESYSTPSPLDANNATFVSDHPVDS